MSRMFSLLTMPLFFPPIVNEIMSNILLNNNETVDNFWPSRPTKGDKTIILSFIADIPNAFNIYGKI